MRTRKGHQHREQTYGCQKGGGGVGKDWEFGISGYKQVYIAWINNKILLYSTGNYIQYPVINHNEKYYEKEYVCVCVYIYIYMNHFTVQQKLTQPCKSTIVQ